MTLPAIIKFLHIASAIAMISGIVGRELIRHQMRKAADLRTIELMLKLVDPFDRLLVIPPSMFLVVFGAILAVTQGWPLLGFLQGANSNWLLVSLVLYLLTIPLVVVIFVPRGKMFGAALKDAQSKGIITPELTAALRDPIDTLGHRLEELAIGVVLFLMVVKPF